MGESLTRSALGSASNSMSWLSETLRCVLNPLRFSSGYSGLLCSPQSYSSADSGVRLSAIVVHAALQSWQQRIPDFFEAPPLKVLHIGGGQMGHSMVTQCQCKPSIKDPPTGKIFAPS